MTESTNRELKILIRRGDSFERTFNIIEQEGTPVNITGWSARLTVKELEIDSAAVIEKSSANIEEIEFLEADIGKLIVYFTPEDTATLAPQTYQYDLQLTDESGNVYTTHKSEFSVLYDITTGITGGS